MKASFIIPEIRFPAFSDNWESSKLSQFLSRYSETNKDEEFTIKDILSLSSQYGIVNRQDILEDTYDKVNHLNYKKTRLNDFVYGKSISATYPYGLFKVNNCKDGLLSTLYFTFKVKENAYPLFLDYYFSHVIRANNFLKQYVLVGDRYITADADYLLSGEIYMPKDILEQQKIASFLNVVDTKLQALKKKKELLEQYKKGVMQKIFSQELRFKDENGKEFPEWEVKCLDEIGEFHSGTGFKNSEQGGKEGIPFFKVSDLNNLGNEIVMNNANNYVTDEQITLNKYKVIKSKSILFAKVGAAIFLERKRIASNFLMDNNMMAYTPNGNIVFFLYSFNLLKLSELSKVGALPSYNASDLSKIKLKLPSNEEQTVIANFLSKIDEKLGHTEVKLQQLNVWKKGLLQKLFI